MVIFYSATLGTTNMVDLTWEALCLKDWSKKLSNFTEE